MNAEKVPPPALGAKLEANGTRFRAFVTAAKTCSVRLYDDDGRELSTHAMADSGDGYFETTLAGVGGGARYRFVVGDRALPDPYARYLPDGVHGAAAVIGTSFPWRHGAGISRPLEEQVLYELHVGTFTTEGTYDAARERLRELAELGITTIELLPIAAFPGARGWGYDGVALFAPFAGYGTPDDLRRFVDEAHGLGLGVFLDVVYNHFGPSGNYLASYSEEYFTREADTPWGEAPNFACRAMRQCVLDNAHYWLTEFRFDGLRLDATPAIFDPSPYPILRELADSVSRIEPRKILIGEDDRNDPEIMRTLGLDGVWSDDFHHQVHAALTGERDGYYESYEPGIEGIAETVSRGWLYEGQFYSFTGKLRGKSAHGLPARSFVYYIQNHDQVGNRAWGERLSSHISLDAYCAASTLLLFLPMTPLLFMGQEWAASSPFLYFTDHDEELGRLISAGRRKEFEAFSDFSDSASRSLIPDPQRQDTFEQSRLRWSERHDGVHRRVLELYRELLRLRRADPVLRNGARERLRIEVRNGLLTARQWFESEQRLLLVNFSDAAITLAQGEEVTRGLRPMLTSGLPLDGDRIPARTAILLGAP